jgi:hypothetical protein
MMLPFRRRPPTSTTKKRTPKSALPSEITQLPLQHVDYNLQPLKVEGLSHYIEPMVEDGRFRVH